MRVALVVAVSVACRADAPVPVVAHAASPPLPTALERLVEIFAPQAEAALAGTVEGLAAPAVTPWGAIGPLAWMYDVGSEKDRPANARYRFSEDGRTWSYVTIDAVPGDRVDDHAAGFELATPTGPYAHPVIDAYTWRRNRVGLAGSLRLVRARVNGGAGTAAAPRWIATDAIELLDGTSAFRPRLDSQATRARAVFDAVVADRTAAALAAGWDHVRGAFPPATEPANLYQRDSIEVAYLRWDRQRRVVTIGFVKVVTAQKLSFTATRFANTLYASAPPPKSSAHYGVVFVTETEVASTGAIADRIFEPSLVWEASCRTRCPVDAANWPSIIPRH